MKTLKILFAAIIFVGFAATANAQEITAHAQVIDEIAFVGDDNQNLNFGVLRVDQDKTITLLANGSVEASGAAGDQVVGITPGRVAFTVGSNANVTVGFSAAGTITGDLDAQYRVYYNFQDGTIGSNQFVDFASDGDTTFQTDGNTTKVYVYIDGRIDAEDATPGEYEDNITITAVYN